MEGRRWSLSSLAGKGWSAVGCRWSLPSLALPPVSPCSRSLTLSVLSLMSAGESLSSLAGKGWSAVGCRWSLPSLALPPVSPCSRSLTLSVLSLMSAGDAKKNRVLVRDALEMIAKCDSATSMGQQRKDLGVKLIKVRLLQTGEKGTDQAAAMSALSCQSWVDMVEMDLKTTKVQRLLHLELEIGHK
ncbi:hypothetical protein Ancab_039105 [Ancistrocladus abbreviatus]